jgi:thiol-disulfide isomerase/thioredoxin
MKSKFHLLLLCCTIAVTTHAQQDQTPLFNLGDPAPSLRVQQWIKGTPVQNFEKGKVYVVEFWATWCQSCMAAMPHLSALARDYKDTVTVIAIDIHETKTTSLNKVKAVVDEMGGQMDFRVVAEDTNFTANDWLDAWGEKDKGIPKTFIVDAHGNIAWIGEPYELNTVLRQIVHNTWDIKEALSKRNFNKYLEGLDHQVAYKLERYRTDSGNLAIRETVRPDSALLIINEMVKKEPGLKYAPVTASFTFEALLKTDPHKAYEYGEAVMVTPTYEEPAYDIIIGVIKNNPQINMPGEIYRLGANCYQAKIDHAPYPQLLDLPKLYRKMADWNSRAGYASKPPETDQKDAKLSESNPGLAFGALEKKKGN